MLSVKTIVNRPVSSSCYVLFSNRGHDCIVVDPGTIDCCELFDFLKENELTPSFTILTHEHIDHIIGMNTLAERFPVKIVCSKKCNELMRSTRYNLSRLTEQFSPYDTFPDASVVFNGKYSLCWQDYSVRLYEGRGHSEGSIFFIVDDCLFVGDTYIFGYPTVTTLPGGSKECLLRTYHKLNNLDYASISKIFQGHNDMICKDIFLKDLSNRIKLLERKLLCKKR